MSSKYKRMKRKEKEKVIRGGMRRFVKYE